MRHRQRERGRHGGIDRVAAALDDLESDLRGDVTLGDHHPQPRALRRRAGLQREGGNGEDGDEDEDSRRRIMEPPRQIL